MVHSAPDQKRFIARCVGCCGPTTRRTNRSYGSSARIKGRKNASRIRMTMTWSSASLVPRSRALNDTNAAMPVLATRAPNNFKNMESCSSPYSRWISTMPEMPFRSCGSSVFTMVTNAGSAPPVIWVAASTKHAMSAAVSANDTNIRTTRSGSRTCDVCHCISVGSTGRQTLRTRPSNASGVSWNSQPVVFENQRRKALTSNVCRARSIAASVAKVTKTLRGLCQSSPVFSPIFSLSLASTVSSSARA
mmetsp:Transcript_33561/g.103958  ORF Transcript_33561/g.103958 Transcript_33561/m.103958 type:complete len:248 (-) Transcript_33561:760-1503(-)